MKKNLFKMLIALTVIAAAALLLSLLGHWEIWIFTNSFNDNLFIAGGIVFAAGIFTQTNTSQYAKGMGVLYSGKNEKPEQHRGHERTRISTLVYLTLLFAAVCLLSFLLPGIRL